MRVVFDHYGDSDEHKQALINEAQVSCISLVCQLHWRFELLFGTWPYPLARLVDPTVSEADKATVREEFLSASPCCLDAYFGAKVRL